MICLESHEGFKRLILLCQTNDTPKEAGQHLELVPSKEHYRKMEPKPINVKRQKGH
jgi:hypothetical protein